MQVCQGSGTLALISLWTGQVARACSSLQTGSVPHAAQVHICQSDALSVPQFLLRPLSVVWPNLLLLLPGARAYHSVVLAFCRSRVPVHTYNRYKPWTWVPSLETSPDVVEVSSVVAVQLWLRLWHCLGRSNGRTVAESCSSRAGAYPFFGGLIF